MCVACGLPTTHSSSFVSVLGVATLTMFCLTTFLGAWWVLSSSRVRAWWHKKKR